MKSLMISLYCGGWLRQKYSVFSPCLRGRVTGLDSCHLPTVQGVSCFWPTSVVGVCGTAFGFAAQTLEAPIARATSAAQFTLIESALILLIQFFCRF
jgi:hypothetical protein